MCTAFLGEVDGAVAFLLGGFYEGGEFGEELELLLAGPSRTTRSAIPHRCPSVLPPYSRLSVVSDGTLVQHFPYSVQCKSMWGARCLETRLSLHLQISRQKFDFHMRKTQTSFVAMSRTNFGGPKLPAALLDKVQGTAIHLMLRKIQY